MHGCIHLHHLLFCGLLNWHLCHVGVVGMRIQAVRRGVLLHLHIVVHRVLHLLLLMMVTESFKRRWMVAKLMRWESLSMMRWKSKRIWILEYMQRHGLRMRMRMRMEAMRSNI